MNVFSYPVIKNIEIRYGVTVPLLDIPMMSDERWNELAAKNRAERLTGKGGAAYV